MKKTTPLRAADPSDALERQDLREVPNDKAPGGLSTASAIVLLREQLAAALVYIERDHPDAWDFLEGCRQVLHETR